MIFEIEYSLENISIAVTKLLEAIEHGPKIWLFRGEMGAGKTTLVKEIGLQKKCKRGCKVQPSLWSIPMKQKRVSLSIILIYTD